MSTSRVRTVSVARRRKVMRIIPPRRCSVTHNSRGEPCAPHYAVVGATVCQKHGAGAPQVRAAAAIRVTLAEAIANADPRHPLEVLASAMHDTDVLTSQALKAMSGDGPVTAEMMTAFLDATKTKAGMAKLVLDAAGPEGWSRQEAYRQQADTLAKICQEMARNLGFDASSELVRQAFEAAVARVVHGKRTRVRATKAQAGPALKAIEGEVVEG